MSDQFVFDFPSRSALDAENFLIATNSQAVLEKIDQWPDWPDNIIMMVGPEGCGKTHLVNVWRRISGARKIEASEVHQKNVEKLAQATDIAIENIDQGDLDETALFHLFNLSREKKHHALLTSRTMPGQMKIALPDLRSRLRSIPVIHLNAPDDALMNAIMLKLLNDRQLDISPDVLHYISNRLERTMPALISFIEKLDNQALRSGKKITKQFVASLLR